MKSMSVLNVISHIFDVTNNFGENDFTNARNAEYSLYVLDLNCNQSVNILTKVGIVNFLLCFTYYYKKNKMSIKMKYP